MFNSFLPDQADIFSDTESERYVAPWRPRALSHEEWPPDYRAVYAWRLQRLEEFKDPRKLAGALAYYSTRPAAFIMDWMDTYNPRKADNKWMPFVFFKRQEEFVQFLHELTTNGENGLVEKCRDAGATWIACGFSVWAWRFVRSDAIGWGSRKEDLVDRIGDPDSIFEKMRLIINRLPPCFLPDGFTPKNHATFMKLINPDNGATVSGEAGDSIGRGGRKRAYFKDESAHYERAEKVEAALGDNTNTQIDISSVNGLGNVFHRRREAGVIWEPGKEIPSGFTRVFIIDWRDHPEKTQDWYDKRRAKYEREGMLHIFAQEVDRNYSAAIANTIIPHDWIIAAVDAHLKLPGLNWSGKWSAALDVADGGMDRNALIKREGRIVRFAREWGERDPGVSTRNTIEECRQHRGIRVQYDSVAIGAAVKAEYNRLVDEKLIDPALIKLVPWNAGAGVKRPYDRVIPDDQDSPINKNQYHNLKAQAWWNLRTCFYKTFQSVVAGAVYPVDEMISLDSAMPLLQQLIKELAQPVSTQSSTLKTMVDKKPDGTKSPNLGDGTVMVFFPMDDDSDMVLSSTYGQN